MKKIVLYSFVFIGIVLICSSNADSKNNKLVVVHWGDSLNINNSTVVWREGMTALTAIQSVAEVDTHPVGKHIFVSSINERKSNRGETAWYYKINVKSAKVLAFTNCIQANDTVLRIFKKRCMFA